MERFPRRAAWLAALASLMLLVAAPAGADSAAGIEFLRTTQQANGGWDDDPCLEFATTEVVLAIAEVAQTGSSWSTADGHAAVDGFHFDDDSTNPNPLDFVDAMLACGLTSGVAAKLVVLVAGPLGLDPAAFDPADGGSPVNLVTAMDPDGCDGDPASFGFFGQTLFGILAMHVACGAAPPAAVAAVRAAQQDDGGWNFTGDPTPQGFDDIDTTGTAIQALVAGGAGATDADVVDGLAFLATRQLPDGTWGFGGAPSAESTSRALLAIAAAGYDPASSCWRDTVAPELAGNPYLSPVDALAALQNADGSWGEFGPDFATAQAIQGLERGWLPVARATAPECPAVPAPGAATSPGGAEPEAATPAGSVAASPRFTG